MAGNGGGWESWESDETLFAGAAPHYVQGRLPYAPGLADALTKALGLDGSGRLLDVGCGPGIVTLLLADLFAQVVGLDPDQEMLQAAAVLASEQAVANATWVRMRAEDLPADLGHFRVVTFAASFHWMERPKVAAAVLPMLDPGGAVVQIHAPAYEPTPTDPALPYPLPPEREIADLRRRYLGADQRAGQSIRNTSPSGEDAVFRAAGFAPARRVIVADGRVLERTVDDIVAFVFSSSSSAPHLFGASINAFEHDLRALLADASRSGVFSVRLPDNIVNIWRVDR
jgi:hypothetical protein